MDRWLHLVIATRKRTSEITLDGHVACYEKKEHTAMRITEFDHNTDNKKCSILLTVHKTIVSALGINNNIVTTVSPRID